MAIRVVVAGATGWVGSALIPAIVKSDDLALTAAVARSAAGEDVGALTGIQPLAIPLSGTLEEALEAPSDVVVDYTTSNVVRRHALLALSKGRHVVIGTSGLSEKDYDDIHLAAERAGLGVIGAGNFSITATLLKRFTLEAAKYLADVEILDYASAQKLDAPSGTARELAEALAKVRQRPTSLPLSDIAGLKDTRGAAVGTAVPVQVHSVRLPSYILSCEAVFGAPDERLTIRHDAGSSPAPYVAGTLFAIRRVMQQVGVIRGLEDLIA